MRILVGVDGGIGGADRRESIGDDKGEVIVIQGKTALLALSLHDAEPFRGETPIDAGVRNGRSPHPQRTLEVLATDTVTQFGDGERWGKMRGHETTDGPQNVDCQRFISLSVHFLWTSGIVAP